MDPLANTSTITTIEQLRALYREPSAVAANKKGHAIDEHTRRYLAASPFCLLATSDANGRCDVSPRGGPPGMVRVLDERRIALPDLNGNNLLDSLQNIVANPHAGLICLIPGLDETIRFDGVASLTTDPTILGLWDDELRTPKLAIVIEVDALFIHCAKAFRRSGLWQPESWPANEALPDMCVVYNGHSGSTLDPAILRTALDQSYVDDLAADQPLPS
ncbi:MAG: pyridoxamine 5'-phosphate oxidase family protein [Acidimicrobiales bacterium]